MKKYPKIVQCDQRGQIVIPKDIRNELKIDKGTGFWMFSIEDEGILLKKIPLEELNPGDRVVREIKEKSKVLGVKEKNMEKTLRKYKKTKEGKLELI